MSVTEREGNGDTNSAVPALRAAESQAGMAAPAQSLPSWRVSARTCRAALLRNRWVETVGAGRCGGRDPGLRDLRGEQAGKGPASPAPPPSAAPALARRLQAPPTTRGPPTAPTAFHPATRRAAWFLCLLRVSGREGKAAREPKAMVRRRGSPPCPQPRLRTLHPHSPRGLP